MKSKPLRTDRQIREQIASLRRELRSRKAGKLGTALAKGSRFRGEHEYLVGQEAHLKRRLEIFRNAGGEAIVFDGTVEELKPANCQGCSETHEVGWVDGEWHHAVKSRGGKRCDCAGCALYVCRAWHQRFHNRVVKFLQRNVPQP